MAVSLKHWKGRRGGGRGGGGVTPPPPAVYGRSNTSLMAGQRDLERGEAPALGGAQLPALLLVVEAVRRLEALQGRGEGLAVAEVRDAQLVLDVVPGQAQEAPAVDALRLERARVVPQPLPVQPVDDARDGP